MEGDHDAGFAKQSLFDTEGAGLNGFQPVCLGLQVAGAALGDVELHGPGLHTQTVRDQLLQKFAAAAEFLVPKAVGVGLGFIFAQQGAVGVLEPFGYTHHNGGTSGKAALHLFHKVLLIKVQLREADEGRVVPRELPGQSAGSGEPAGIASHDLHDGDCRNVVNRSVQTNLPHGGSHETAALPKPGV